MYLFNVLQSNKSYFDWLGLLFDHNKFAGKHAFITPKSQKSVFYCRLKVLCNMNNSDIPISLEQNADSAESFHTVFKHEGWHHDNNAAYNSFP